SSNLDEVLGRVVAPRGVRRHERLTPANPRLAEADRWWDFLNSKIQFLYLWLGKDASDSQSRPDETLFILRGNSADDERQREHGPIALEANVPEMNAFKDWLNRLELSS